MLEIITPDNIHLGCRAKNKNDVLSMVGNMFEQRHYVSKNCVELLHEREKQVSTFLGNGIVLPHLPKSAQSIIQQNGIEIFQFPDGVIWDRTNVMFIAVSVVAKNKEHIDVLREIATIFSDEIVANALSLISNKNDFMRILLAK